MRATCNTKLVCKAVIKLATRVRWVWLVEAWTGVVRVVEGRGR